MTSNNDFSNYLDLVKKVDDKFSEIYEDQKENFSCQKGCHECCAPDLSVSVVEKEYIKNFLTLKPELVENLRELKRKNPHNGKRCQLLNEKGLCSIYEARPLICRSHGAPIYVPDEENPKLDVCPLNFKEVDLSSISENNKININILNTILALVNMKEFSGRHQDRFKLDVDDLLD